MVHEDTLAAITFLCDTLEEHAFEESNDYQGDEHHECIICSLCDDV
jgi:hypothetical protein